MKKESILNLIIDYREIWREDAKGATSLDSMKQELHRNERILAGCMDRSTSHGLQAVKRIAAKLNLDGVYGPIYELFEVDDVYSAAVEVIGGSRYSYNRSQSSLFNVVVDTDQTASKLLEELNREQAGRVTFMPLNRLHPKPATYPESNDVIPMIKKLRYNSLYEKAFVQVIHDSHPFRYLVVLLCAQN